MVPPVQVSVELAGTSSVAAPASVAPPSVTFSADVVPATVKVPLLRTVVPVPLSVELVLNVPPPVSRSVITEVVTTLLLTSGTLIVV
jgi:hypothetical protein